MIKPTPRWHADPYRRLPMIVSLHSAAAEDRENNFHTWDAPGRIALRSPADIALWVPPHKIEELYGALQVAVDAMLEVEWDLQHDNARLAIDSIMTAGALAPGDFELAQRIVQKMDRRDNAVLEEALTAAQFLIAVTRDQIEILFGRELGKPAIQPLIDRIFVEVNERVSDLMQVPRGDIDIQVERNGHELSVDVISARHTPVTPITLHVSF